MPPQRTNNLDLSGTDSCTPVNVTVTGVAGPTGPTGGTGPCGPPGPRGGCTGLGYEPLPSNTYNEFTPGIKTFHVPDSATNAYISGMYIRIRDATYPSWFMNGMIISYIGTTLTVDVDSVTLGEDIESCIPSTRPCGTPGTLGQSCTPNPAATPLYTLGNAATCAPCNATPVVTYTSYSRNVITPMTHTFIIEGSPAGIFSPGMEIRATDHFYPSWYMDGTVVGYTGGNLTVITEYVQIGVGEITNELVSTTAFRFETGIKEFLIVNDGRISAFTSNTSVRITTPNMTIGTYMNGTVISFIGNVLRVNVENVRTATGFAPYNQLVCDWCIQALVSNDTNSGNNWRVSIREPIGLNSNSRLDRTLGTKIINVVSGPTATFTAARGVRITDKTDPTWYMDGTISGYTGATGTNLIVEVNNSNNGTLSNIVYQLTSTTVNQFTTTDKTFVVPITNTITAFTNGSSVKIRALNMSIGDEMFGNIKSYIGSSLVIENVTVEPCGTSAYSGNVNNWHIEVLPLNFILSGSDWVVTIRNASGTRTNTRTKFLLGQQTFTIQDGPTTAFTNNAIIRVTDRVYPAWYMDGRVTSAYTAPSLNLNILQTNNGPVTTNIVNKLTSISSFKFEPGSKQFVVQDIKNLHLFTPGNKVTLTARNLWIGMEMIGTISSYINDRLTIVVGTNPGDIKTATGFVTYTEFVNNWNIEADACDDDDISGGDWVLTPSPLTVPGAPTGVVAVPTDVAANVSWNAPVNNGYAVISSYTITSSGNTPIIRQVPANTNGVVPTTLLFTGLTIGQSYTFTVTATNVIGSSDPSTASIPVTIGLSAPIVTATAGDTQATVRWVQPTSSIPISGYTVTRTSTTNGVVTVVDSQITNPAQRLLTISSLNNGTAYRFKVVANNTTANGQISSGIPSPPTPPAVPGTAPTGVEATAGDSRATVRWTPPTPVPGISITGYTVKATYTPSGATESESNFYTAASTARSLTIESPSLSPPLVNGRSYTFTVAATTTVSGVTAAEAVSGETTAVVPGPVPATPANVTAVPGHLSATISWSIVNTATSYIIRGFNTTTGVPTETKYNVTALTTTITGLTNGQAYTFSVEATLGTGTTATVGLPGYSSSTTIAGLLAPTGVEATAGNANATVRWTPPTTVPGISITGYTVKATYTPSGATESVSNFYTALSTVRLLTIPSPLSPLLVNGTSYTFTVAATTTVGDTTYTGAASGETTAVVPGPVPATPANVTAVPGHLSATISWSIVNTATSYIIRGFNTTTGVPTETKYNVTALTTTITGLTNGQAYTFSVEATLGTGTTATVGLPGYSSSTTIAGLLAPTGVEATAGNANATVRWTPPTTVPGISITGYTVKATYTPSGATESESNFYTAASTARSLTIESPSLSPPLVNGRSYTFTVAATTTVNGATATGAVSNETTPVVPGAAPAMPTGVTAVPGPLTATISWQTVNTATGYIIRGTDNESGVPTETKYTVTELTATITGLTDGRAYTFTVEATLGTGTTATVGPPGYSSGIVIGRVPTLISATPVSGTGEVALVWAAPIPLGSVTQFRVKAQAGLVIYYEDVSNTVTSLTFGSPELTLGTTYVFSVASRIGEATGPFSGTIVAVPE